MQVHFAIYQNVDLEDFILSEMSQKQKENKSTVFDSNVKSKTTKSCLIYRDRKIKQSSWVKIRKKIEF